MVKDEVFFSIYNLVEYKKGILIVNPPDSDEKVNLHLPNVTRFMSQELSDLVVGRRGELRHKDSSQKGKYILRATFELVEVK